MPRGGGPGGGPPGGVDPETYIRLLRPNKSAVASRAGHRFNGIAFSKCFFLVITKNAVL